MCGVGGGCVPRGEVDNRKVPSHGAAFEYFNSVKFIGMTLVNKIICFSTRSIIYHLHIALCVQHPKLNLPSPFF